MPISMDLSETLLYCKHHLSLSCGGFIFCFKLCFVCSIFFQYFIFWCRELARGLGEKGAIVFSDFEHVILKGMPIFLFYYIAFF